MSVRKPEILDLDPEVKKVRERNDALDEFVPQDAVLPMVMGGLAVFSGVELIIHTQEKALEVAGAGISLGGIALIVATAVYGVRSALYKSRYPSH
jgi:hypothetical protein